MRRALILLAALALGAAPTVAGATTVPTLTLTQQAKKADVIVRATLGTPTSVKEGEVTWLAYPLTVTETIAGDAASLPQVGGKPTLYLLAGLEGTPDLRAGQDAFLLLYNRRLDSPIVGFWQGVYPIENGRVTRAASSLAPAPVTPPAPAQAATGTPATGTAAVGTATSTTPSSGTTTPGTATTGSTTTPTTAGTTGTASTSTPAAPGSASGTATTTPPSTTTGTTPPAPTAGSGSAPAASPISPASAASSGTAAPASPGTASTPPPNDPNAIETDPAKFRDALRAARGAQ